MPHLDIEKIKQANQWLVSLSSEPYASYSGLDFAIDEYNHSKQRDRDFALMLFRIDSVHVFAQGNKRVCLALFSEYYSIDENMTKEALVRIANNPSMNKEKGIEMLLKCIRDKRVL